MERDPSLAANPTNATWAPPKSPRLADPWQEGAPSSGNLPARPAAFSPSQEPQLNEPRSVIQDSAPAYPPEEAKPIEVFPGSGNRVPFDRGFRDDGYAGTDLQGLDDGQTFPHETKGQSPSMREVLCTGRFFASAEWRTFQPHFQNNFSFTSASPANATSQAFDWGYESTPAFRLGFESKRGPGVELDSWQFDHESRPVSAASDGVTIVTASLPLNSFNGFGDLVAANPGESIVGRQVLELHSLGTSFFKELKLPISRLNGLIGLRYLSLAQMAQADLMDAGNSTLGTVRQITDFRGFGPRFKLEYFRPIGHTRLESIGTFGTALLFGNRDQFVENSIRGDYSRTNNDELVTLIEASVGVQYVRNLAENRSLYCRVLYQSQSWLGGGTAADPAGDFGFRGVGIALGLNR